MLAQRLGYVSQGTTAGAQVVSGPSGFFGLISTVTGGAVTIYDGTSTSGNILFSKTLTVGEVVHFGGMGIAAGNGLFIVCTGTVVVLFS